jgi:hypothetical protein
MPMTLHYLRLGFQFKVKTREKFPYYLKILNILSTLKLARSKSPQFMRSGAFNNVTKFNIRRSES